MLVARHALAILLVAGASPVLAQADLPIRDTTLANGLQVIVIENHAVPLATVELDVKNGGYTQTPEYEGLAHLYEHMFFKANRVIPSQERYLQRLRQLGTVWNGTTSDERVNYYITVGVDSLLPTMQFLRDAVRYPLFQQDELVRERPVVIGEFDRAEADPYFHLNRAIDTVLWSPAYWSRKNVMGNREVILTTSQAKMREIQSLYYIPNNTALILAGDVSPAQGFRAAVEVFGDWPRGADPFATAIPDPPPLTKSRAVIVTQPVKGASVYLKFHGPSVTRDPASTYAADVLSSILNKRSSRFNRRLVDSGIAFESNISYYTLGHVGPIAVTLETTPERVLDAEHAALEEIARFSDSTYVSQQELSDAQAELGIQVLYEREQATNLAHTVGFWWAVAGPDYYRDYVRNMQRVTRTDLARYARTYLQNKPYVVGVLLSPEARQQTGLTAESLLPKELVP